MKRDVGLPEYSVQLCDPERPITMVNMSGDRRRWEIMLMPGDDPNVISAPENVWKLLARWVTPHQAAIERSAVYTFHSVIAEGWRSGRMLIAGDAAHQTPPFLGQGMCAGIRDAANLWWKLDLVCKGETSTDILDTYESERAPHVRAFIELAVQLGGVIQTTDAQAAKERDLRFRAGGAQVFSFPSPQLGPGLGVGDGAPVGSIFPQPTLQGSLRLDRVLGPHFAVLTSTNCEAEVNDLVQPGHAAGAFVMAPCDPAIDQWLEDHQAIAVVLRPDRYVLGIARTVDDIPALLTAIPVLLH